MLTDDKVPFGMIEWCLGTTLANAALAPCDAAHGLLSLAEQRVHEGASQLAPFCDAGQSLILIRR